MTSHLNGYTQTLMQRCLRETSHGISGDLANRVEGVWSFSWPDRDVVRGGLCCTRVHCPGARG